ncbi:MULTISPECIES: Fpg/Nei family DNA glycosylase [Streptomyces]|uniref:Fpg/Nei family DNA glycosylase n=1 Tax=Streptomyces TaxID=1883 RepID=UPI00163C8934|nr:MULTISPECIES: Fpg/Nei family DNA glycosylase [Streptomyces]MBC2878735.1 Fpg/Nei family DNA glycosylase [Streptomyces sp. TYQ1024]UBI35178.1 DNA glycosylase [Streptomyces mobaraensis]UKW27770.1 DNA glycosylase [Streptomyces sp. TYQ1024]
MPEGDTVWRTARRLHRALAGTTLTRGDLRVPALATTDLGGRDVVEAVSRGKHLLLRLDGGLTLHSHLGMEGSWRVHAAGERPRGGPGHQIRAVLANDRHVAVGYRLPVLELLRTADESTVVGHLGPDLLGPDWDAAEALRRLLADPGRAVGDALLDQRNLAGVGNVYKSEICYMLRISPWLPMGRVPSPARLPALARKLLDVNKDRSARITTADPHPDRRLWVYGRAGRPCRRCGGPVRLADQGEPGRERPTYWCPRCQGGTEDV